MQMKGDQGTMVLKATNQRAFGANHPQRPGRQSRTKGSPVTEHRARAQRAKLDAQAQARQAQEEQAPAIQTIQQKKTVRQELQARRRAVEALIEAYLQDQIG